MKDLALLAAIKYQSSASPRPTVASTAASTTVTPSEPRVQLSVAPWSPTIPLGRQIVDRPDWSMIIRIGDSQQYEVRRWDGEQLAQLFAIDTETELAVPGRIPAVAMATVFDGRQLFVVLPRDIGRLIEQHADCQIVAHNAPFDYHVVLTHLQQSAPHVAVCWRNMADRFQLHCTMTLADLVRVAEHDAPIGGGRGLDDLAANWLGIKLDKTDPYRQRYGELVGHDWSRPVDHVFIAYAAADPVVTLQLWHALVVAAGEVLDNLDFDSSMVQRFGYFGESLITRSNLVLAATTYRGVDIDRSRLGELRQALREQAKNCVTALDEIEPTLFKRYRVKSRQGQLKYDPAKPNAVVPQKSTGVIRKRLERFAGDRRIAVETTPTGELKLDTKWWSQYRDADEFIDRWIELAETEKLLQFVEKVPGSRVFPRYDLARSGRSTCSGPNLQQLPAREEFRRIVIPGESKVLLGVDYAGLEMCCLAAECYARFGSSRLRDALTSGYDLHCYTAAILNGMEYADFLLLKKTDPTKYKHDRQKAKVVNFGVPGGFQAKSLARTSLLNYGVPMTVEEAATLRSRLIGVVFPELELYLAEPSLREMLAIRLGVKQSEVDQAFPNDWELTVLHNLCFGRTINARGEPYSSAGRLLDATRILAARGQLILLPEYDSSNCDALREYRRLVGHTVVLAGGLVRGNTSFTAACNSGFQTRAAMGARQALWATDRAGYELIGFIHDELLFALPEGCDYTMAANNVARLMIDAMQPFCGDVPVKVEYYLARHWSKSAEAVFDADGRLHLWDG